MPLLKIMFYVEISILALLLIAVGVFNCGVLALSWNDPNPSLRRCALILFFLTVAVIVLTLIDMCSVALRHSI